jgi:hypothetical protein
MSTERKTYGALTLLLPVCSTVPVIREYAHCGLNAVTTFVRRVGYLAVPYAWYFFPKRRYIVFLVCTCFVTGAIVCCTVHIL